MTPNDDPTESKVPRLHHSQAPGAPPGSDRDAGRAAPKASRSGRDDRGVPAAPPAPSGAAPERRAGDASAATRPAHGDAGGMHTTLPGSAEDPAGATRPAHGDTGRAHAVRQGSDRAESSAGTPSPRAGVSPGTGRGADGGSTHGPAAGVDRGSDSGAGPHGADTRRWAEVGEALLGGDSVRAAERVLRSVLDDPSQAREDAEDLLRTQPGVEAEVIARRALGLAVRELGDLEVARGHLCTAIDSADAAGLAERAGQARLTLIGVLADLGRLDDALQVADQAAAVLRGLDADRLLGHRALVLCRSGRFTDGLRLGDQALRRLRADDDPTFVSGFLNNRGLARAYAGDLRRAAADLEHAARVADDAGIRRLAAMARANLGFVAQRRGDLAEALHRYAQAEPEFTDAAGRALAIDADHAATLLTAGLNQEARRLLTHALDHLTAHPTDAAEARLLLAHAELACGHPTASASAAEVAHTAFTTQNREGWALLAEHAHIHARFIQHLNARNPDAGPADPHPAPRQAGPASPDSPGAPAGRPEADAPPAEADQRTRLFDDARNSAEKLAQWGWRLAATHGRIIAARLALNAGHTETAASILTPYARPPRSGTAEERIAHWHATALARLASGRRAGALAAVRAGLRDAAAYADALEATELRMHAAVRGADLAALGLRLALDSHRAHTVLAWIERGRAITGRAPAVRPPDDPDLATALADLRRTTAELADAVATERPHAHALRLHHAAENRVRRLTRTAPRRLRTRTAHEKARRDRIKLRQDDLFDALEDRAFLAYASTGGSHLAVSVVNGRRRLHELDHVRVAAIRAVRFAVNRLAQRRTAPGREPDAAYHDLVAVAGELDRALFPGPVRHAIGERDLVLAPCGPLHTLPWAALPSTAYRPCAVAPSASAWLAARRADHPRTGRTLLVSGPDVPQAGDEITGLAGLHPDADVLTGPYATTSAVTKSLDGADLAHISAHASYRPGNALLSEIRLADGALYGHDLAALADPPRRVVLSTCDAALGDVTPADRPLGPAGALLDGGTATVVASVAPVNDAETTAFMLNLHHHLARGHSPAHALAAVPRTPGVLGFTCLGAGT